MLRRRFPYFSRSRFAGATVAVIAASLFLGYLADTWDAPFPGWVVLVVMLPFFFLATLLARHLKLMKESPGQQAKEYPEWSHLSNRQVFQLEDLEGERRAHYTRPG